MQTDMTAHIIVSGCETVSTTIQKVCHYQYSTSRTDCAVSQPLQTFFRAISPCRTGYSYTSHTVMTWGEEKHVQIHIRCLPGGKGTETLMAVCSDKH